MNDRLIMPTAEEVEKWGYFMGWGIVDDHGLYTYKYASYRNAEAIKELAPEFALISLGPLAKAVPGMLNEIIMGVNALKWPVGVPELYTFESPIGSICIFVANHIPSIFGSERFEQLADHTECTSTHCTYEDEPA